jgi:hypothetical protein
MSTQPRIETVDTLLVDLPTTRPLQLSMTTMRGQTLLIVDLWRRRRSRGAWSRGNGIRPRAAAPAERKALMTLDGWQVVEPAATVGILLRTIARTYATIQTNATRRRSAMTKANINRSQTAMSTKSYDAGDECHHPLHDSLPVPRPRRHERRLSSLNATARLGAST